MFLGCLSYMSITYASIWMQPRQAIVRRYLQWQDCIVSRDRLKLLAYGTVQRLYRFSAIFVLMCYVSCINYQISRRSTRLTYFWSLRWRVCSVPFNKTHRRLYNVATDACFRQSDEEKARSPLIMKRRSCQTFNYALIGIELTCPRQTDSKVKFDERMWLAIENYAAWRCPHDWINFYRQRAVHFFCVPFGNA